MKTYIVTEQFDMYTCSSGRVTVNPGAMFCRTGDGRVYFINSRNYLPFDVTGSFLKSNKYELYNAFSEKHRALKEQMDKIVAEKDQEDVEKENEK